MPIFDPEDYLFCCFFRRMSSSLSGCSFLTSGEAHNFDVDVSTIKSIHPINLATKFLQEETELQEPDPNDVLKVYLRIRPLLKDEPPVTVSNVAGVY